MKHYFIVNPKSGKNEKIDVINDLVIPAAEKTGIDYEIHETTGPNDATRFVDETAEAAGKEKVRFYAVGGDGTLYEVVNGAHGHKNAEVAAVPRGSGNDWIRLFGEKEVFLDVEGNINGTPVTLDCIKVNDEIALNQASMGFDAEACSEQGKMKSIPGAVGHITYTLAGLYCAITRVKHDFTVKVDGREIKGPFIQVTVCNSRWYGSGIQAAPFAVPDDGKLDVVAIKRVTSWPKLFYDMMVTWQMLGKHVNWSYTEYIRGKKVEIESPKPCAINVDGECHPTEKAVMEIEKNGITFVVPAGSSYFEDKKSGKINNKIKLNIRHKEPLKSVLVAVKPYNRIVNRKYRRK